MSFREFVDFIKENNKHILTGVSPDILREEVINNWANIPDYEQGLALVLKDPIKDRHGQKLLEILRGFMESLDEEEIAYIREQSDKSNTSPDNLTTARGYMEKPGKRIPALEGLLDILESVLQELELENDQIVAIRYIITAIKEHIKSTKAKKVEEAKGPGILERVGQAAKKAVGAVVGAVTSPKQTATDISEGFKSAVSTFKESAFAKRAQENKIFQATIGLSLIHI